MAGWIYYASCRKNVMGKKIKNLIKKYGYKWPMVIRINYLHIGLVSFLCLRFNKVFNKEISLFSLFFPKLWNSCITVVKYLKSIIFKVFEKNKEKKANLYLCWKKKRFSNYAFFCFFQRFIEEILMEISNQLALSCFFVLFWRKSKKNTFH